MIINILIYNIHNKFIKINFLNELIFIKINKNLILFQYFLSYLILK